ncbi:MAG: YdcF family protein [Pyrinomonadaceae bacterium]|nr:YdcF family protein [Pyrinomonadaceae bacterium]
MLKLVVLVLAGFALLTVAFTVTLRWQVQRSYREKVYASAQDVAIDGEARVGIVFGAGVWRNGEPSPVLYDRVATAAELYHAGRVQKLLLTGDNRFVNYNEPQVMRRTALAMGVPDEALVLDYAGRSTYDSCYRAREIFGVGRAALITQRFHLDRALYLCDELGVDGIGVAADRRAYGQAAQMRWSLREIPAILRAWLDLHIIHPQPILGEKTSIRIEAAPIR